MKKEDLKNGEIYAIDKKEFKQFFMFSSFSKTECPYSILIESPNTDIEKFQRDEISKETLEATKIYLSQNGPKVNLEDVREASEREKKFFKSIVLAAGYSIDPNTQVVTSYDNVEKELIESTEITNRYKDLKAGEIYQFEVSNDASAGCLVIIGQVEEVNGASIRLSAYAHQSDLEHEPCPIYDSTIIIAPHQYKVPFISDYYLFVHHLISVLENKPGIEQKRIETLYHEFAKRLVEDVDRGAIILVHRSEKDAYYVYLPISPLNSGDEPLCEVTNVICKMFTDFYTSDPKDRTRYLETSFGEGRIVELDEYLSYVERMKTIQTLDNVSEQEDAVDDNNVMKNPYKNFNFREGSKIVIPGIYKNTLDAAETISIDDDAYYLIINDKEKNGKFAFVLSDDPHSVLHSRKLDRYGLTVIYGPLRDAEATFKFIIKYIDREGWAYNDGTIYKHNSCADELIDAITYIQKHYATTPYQYDYQIFELPLNRL